MTYPIPTSVKQAVRQRYAWPGGYPLFVICHDGGCLCIKCTRSEWSSIARSTVSGMNDGWRVVAADINWEDGDLLCDHCNDPIEAAYTEN